MKLTATALILLCTLLLAGTAHAQKTIAAPEQRVSPVAVAKTTLQNGTYVKVVYGSPRRQDPKTGQVRTIFGGVVPYNEVWRLGANEATELTTTGDIQLGDQAVPAGTYALFAIPGKEQWTIILNRGLGQWGAYDYDAKKDAFRFTVPVTTIPDTYDAFTISFDEAGDPRSMNIAWDQTRLVIPVRAR